MASQEIEKAIKRGIEKAEAVFEASSVIWVKVCNMVIPFSKETGKVVKQSERETR